MLPKFYIIKANIRSSCPHLNMKYFKIGRAHLFGLKKLSREIFLMKIGEPDEADED